MNLLTLEPTRQLREEDRLRLKGDLYRTAGLFDAEHVATEILHGTWAFQPAEETFVAIGQQRSKRFWRYLKALWPRLSDVSILTQRTYYTTIAAMAANDEYVFDELIRRWAGRHTTPARIYRAAMRGIHTTQMPHLTTFDDLRRGRIAEIHDNCFGAFTVHPIPEDLLSDLTLDGFTVRTFQDTAELVEDAADNWLGGRWETGPPLGAYWSPISNQNVRDIHVLRYDDAEGPLFYCALSLYYERLDWFYIRDSRSVYVVKSRRRLGGKIGIARQSRKTLELLTA